MRHCASKHVNVPMVLGLLLAPLLLTPLSAQAVKMSMEDLFAQTIATTVTSKILDNEEQCTKSDGETTRFGSLAYEVPDNFMRPVNNDWDNMILAYRPLDRANISRVYFCPLKVHAAYINQDGTLKNEYVEANAGAQYLIAALNNILWIIAKVGGWLVWLASLVLVPMLTWSTFVRDPLVTSGWTFLQGMANLGFIFALLFIAVATTLQLDIGSPKKMLPRLLIAALLINFSLVIAGVVLDMSRVVMAIIMRAIIGIGTNIEDLPIKMLASSDLMGAAFDTGTLRTEGSITLKASSTHWSSVHNVAMATLFIWVTAVAFIIIAVGLFIRYIALVLLLIVSPIAYLAIAFPGMQGVAKKWWASFLKYVIYGPVMLFVLALIVVGSNIAQVDELKGAEYSFARAAINVVIMLGLSIAGAVAGSKLGVIGANATVNFAKRVPGMAYRNPKTTAAILGGVATGGAGWLAAGAGVAGGALAAKAGQRGYREARDFTKEATKPIRKKFGIGEYSKYDEKGNLKAGKTSIGKSWGSRMPGVNKEDALETRRTAALGEITPGNIDHDNLLPTQLSKGHVLQALASHPTLGHKNVNRVAGFGSAAQQMAIARNKDYVRALKTEQLAELQVAMRGNTTVSTGDQAKAIDRLQQTLDEIAKE